MKHSEALRKGMQIHPAEVSEAYVSFAEDDRILGTCAVVAIYEGRMGRIETYQEFSRLHDKGAFWLHHDMHLCDQCEHVEEFSEVLDAVPLDAHLIHLTDKHGYSRERIAQWLDARGL